MALVGLVAMVVGILGVTGGLAVAMRARRLDDARRERITRMVTASLRPPLPRVRAPRRRAAPSPVRVPAAEGARSESVTPL